MAKKQSAHKILKMIIELGKLVEKGDKTVLSHLNAAVKAYAKKTE